MQPCTDCDLCYCTSFEACYGYFNVEVGLTPSTSYFVWIKDRFDKFYTIQTTSDTEGNISIPLTDFPEGLFTEFAGKFILTISTKENENTKEDMTIAYDIYSCFVFDVFSKTEI